MITSTEQWVDSEQAMRMLGCCAKALFKYREHGLIEYRSELINHRNKFLHRFSDVVALSAIDKSKRIKRGGARVKNQEPKFREESATLTAICPRCGAKHRIKMLWCGSGTPRLYCTNCREYAERWSTSYSNSARI